MSQIKLITKLTSVSNYCSPRHVHVSVTQFREKMIHFPNRLDADGKKVILKYDPGQSSPPIKRKVAEVPQFTTPDSFIVKSVVPRGGGLPEKYLHPKFKRSTLTDEEIDAINFGWSAQ